MSIYAFKPAFQKLLRPITRRLYHAGVNANQVTLFACFLSICLGGLLYWLEQRWLFILLPIWLFIRMALNAIDGMLAREHHQQSALGGYLNELTDVIADTALYFPFYILPFISFTQILLFIWLTMLSEMAGILGAIHGNCRRYDGPMGKSDRAFVMGTLAFITAVFNPVTLATIFHYLMWGVNLLLVITIYRRIHQGLIKV